VAAAKLSPDERREVLRAWAKPEASQELHGLGVRVLPASGASHVYVPADDKLYIMGRVASWLADDSGAGPAKGKPGRPRVTVTRDTFVGILKQSLERAQSTARPPQPSYEAIATYAGVKRTWVTPIVEWTIAHPREALEAIRLSKIPERFSTIVSE
jgi:hypothetical protein